MANVTVPSITSTVNVENSFSSSRRKHKNLKQARYNDLPDDVKKSFKSVLKKTANPASWRIMAERLQFSEMHIKDIEDHYLSNNDEYSPYEEILQIYEDADRTIRTLFIQLGRLNLIEAIQKLQNYVPEKYHKVIEGDFSMITTEITTPIISLLIENNDSASTITSTSSTVEINTVSAVPEVDFDDLEKATRKWDETLILGKGGFGAVFNGTWKNTEVAIKRIQVHNQNLSKRDNDRFHIELRQSLNELRSLSQYRHDNIVQIYGYSANIGKPYCLIYELMRGGTLKDKLENSQSFPWNLRIRIMLETARGLQFLHDTKKSGGFIIHGDIKPANILLDEHMKAKIGDFGLARESRTKAGEIISRIFGTQPYLPEEYITHKKLSPKVDSFSFGIVLFEVATKKRVVDKSRTPLHLNKLVMMYKNKEIDIENIMDTSEGTSTKEIELFETFVNIGLECVKEEKERSDMLMVYKKLEPLHLSPETSEMEE